MRKNVNYTKIFVLSYVVLSVYFAGVMVRLLLVMAPAVCIASGVGISWVFRIFAKSIRNVFTHKNKAKIPFEFSIIGFVLISYFVCTYIFHSNFTAAEAYSSPSIIMSNKDANNNKVIIDDFRESY